MSINPLYSHLPLSGAPVTSSSPVSTPKVAFAFFLDHIPPTADEIKSLATYLEWRLSATFVQAIGDNYSTPLPLFMTPQPDIPLTEDKLEGIIASAAHEYGIDPQLIRAVIQAESGGNSRAVSPRGAMGLMQLMPGTARELGVGDPFDPQENVRAGTRYLKSLLERYQGNVDLALAAYNWGPGNLERSHRSLPTETVNYIAKIKRLLGGVG